MHIKLGPIPSRQPEQCCAGWPRCLVRFSSVQFSRSVVSDSLRPHRLQHARLPVHHQLPEFTQTHVHWVGDAIQPSHPLSSPSPAFNLSQHHGLFQWVEKLFASGGQSIGASDSGLVLSIKGSPFQPWIPVKLDLQIPPFIFFMLLQVWSFVLAADAEEPGGLQTIGSQRVRHDGSDLACTRADALSFTPAVDCTAAPTLLPSLCPGHCVASSDHGPWFSQPFLNLTWAPKSLQIVTAAMKLKDVCSLDGVTLESKKRKSVTASTSSPSEDLPCSDGCECLDLSFSIGEF